MRWISKLRPSPAMVVALMALFVALGGVGYAAATIGSAQIKNNSVRGKDIRNSTITAKDVKNNSLTGTDVRNGRLTGKDVKDDSLTGDDILESSLGQVPSAKTADTVQPNGVNTTAIQDNAVTTTKVADDAITAPKIAASAVGSSELGTVQLVSQTVVIGNGLNAAPTHTTPCPAGSQVISGGGFPSNFGTHMVSNSPSGNSWFAAFQNVVALSGSNTITVRALCLLPQP